MKSQIKIALLGAGRMGKTHYDNLKSMQDINIKYIYDPNLNNDHKLLFDPKILTNNLDKILIDKEIETCIISAPSNMHVELIEKCAKNKIKHIFCEKPISFELSKLYRIKKITEDLDIKLQVGFNRRFDPSIKKIKSNILNKSIGDIHIIKITNRDPEIPNIEFAKKSGGIFLDFNIHDFDILKFISGIDIEEVYAVGDALIDHRLKSLDDLDTALIQVKLQNGALAIIDCSRQTGYGYDQQIEVLGSKAMLHMKNKTQTSVNFLSKLGNLSDKIKNNFQERYSESYYDQLINFFNALRNNKLCSPNISDAIYAVNIALSARKSYTNNKPQKIIYSKN